MIRYLLYIGMILGLPFVYWIILEWQKPYFELEKNKNRKILSSVPEYLGILISEAALLKLILLHNKGLMEDIVFALLYVVLIAMTILCITDLWEKIVPNKILIVLILSGFLAVGTSLIRNAESVVRLIPSMILGFLFCFLTFGVAYMISKGSLGSGDVKLALILGILLTGEYVVGTVFYGCLVGAIYSIVQLCRKKLTRNDELPFVPFLYVGLIITYLVG